MNNNEKMDMQTILLTMAGAVLRVPFKMLENNMTEEEARREVRHEARLAQMQIEQLMEDSNGGVR